jgi:hypothetical protein
MVASDPASVHQTAKGQCRLQDQASGVIRRKQARV